MSANDGLLAILKDALNRLGTVSGRRMFGGVGVYFDGIFFALIADGIIYFRISPATRPAFEAEGSRAFSYATKNGKTELHSYWRLPERLLDDPEELSEWAKGAISAALDVQAAKEREKKAKNARALSPATAQQGEETRA